MNKFILYNLVISTVLILMDLYIVRSWIKFTKKHDWHKISRIIPWTLFTIFSILILYRIVDFAIDRSTMYEGRILSIIIFTWYLPKILLFPIILIKDLLAWIGRKANKLRKAEQKPVNEKRREMIKTAGWGLAGIPFFMVAHGMTKTVYDFKVYREEIYLDTLPQELDGLTIAQLSDVHAGSFFDSAPFTEASYITNSLNPDLIMLTGDFVNGHPDEIKRIREGLKNLRAKYGVYGCLGNHDHYMSKENTERLINELEATGMKLLINDNTTLMIKDKAFQIAGVDNSSWRDQFADFDKAMSSLDSSLPTVMLCHDPTNWDKSIRGQHAADLTLAGHTHGGQVNFNVFGTYINPVKQVYNQWAGLYTEEGQHIYVNRGIGTTGPPIRLGIKPEISLLTLRTQNNMA